MSFEQNLRENHSAEFSYEPKQLEKLSDTELLNNFRWTKRKIQEAIEQRNKFKNKK